MRKKKPTPDLRVSGLATSVILIEPVSPAAREWVGANIAIESWQWLGNAFACEPRSFGNLYAALAEEGFSIEGA